MAKEMKMKQVQLLIPSHEVMNHFCYAYAKSLLEKLIRLDAEDRIFEDGITKAIKLEETDYDAKNTEIADVILSHLENQINFPMDMARIDRPSRFSKLIAVAEEFLAIFEV